MSSSATPALLSNTIQMPIQSAFHKPQQTYIAQPNPQYMQDSNQSPTITVNGTHFVVAQQQSTPNYPYLIVPLGHSQAAMPTHTSAILAPSTASSSSMSKQPLPTITEHTVFAPYTIQSQQSINSYAQQPGSLTAHSSSLASASGGSVSVITDAPTYHSYPQHSIYATSVPQQTSPPPLMVYAPSQQMSHHHHPHHQPHPYHLTPSNAISMSHLHPHILHATPHPSQLVPAIDDDDSRRARHIKSPHQMKVLKAYFATCQKPSKEQMKALCKDTLCTYSEICRWFRNERHKEKKLHHGGLTSASTSASTDLTINKPVKSESHVDIHSPADSLSGTRSSCSSAHSSPVQPSTSLQSKASPDRTSTQSEDTSLEDGASASNRLRLWLREFETSFASDSSLQLRAISELSKRLPAHNNTSNRTNEQSPQRIAFTNSSEADIDVDASNDERAQSMSVDVATDSNILNPDISHPTSHHLSHSRTLST